MLNLTQELPHGVERMEDNIYLVQGRWVEATFEIQVVLGMEGKALEANRF